MLDGEDPVASRVVELVARSKNGSSRLDHTKFAEELARFGSIDTKMNPNCKSEVLVAVAGIRT